MSPKRVSFSPEVRVLYPSPLECLHGVPTTEVVKGEQVPKKVTFSPEVRVYYPRLSTGLVKGQQDLSTQSTKSGERLQPTGYKQLEYVCDSNLLGSDGCGSHPLVINGDVSLCKDELIKTDRQLVDESPVKAGRPERKLGVKQMEYCHGKDSSRSMVGLIQKTNVCGKRDCEIVDLEAGLRACSFRNLQLFEGKVFACTTELAQGLKGMSKKTQEGLVSTMRLKRVSFAENLVSEIPSDSDSHGFVSTDVKVPIELYDTINDLLVDAGTEELEVNSSVLTVSVMEIPLGVGQTICDGLMDTGAQNDGTVDLGLMKERKKQQDDSKVTGLATVLVRGDKDEGIEGFAPNQEVGTTEYSDGLRDPLIETLVHTDKLMNDIDRRGLKIPTVKEFTMVSGHDPFKDEFGWFHGRRPPELVSLVCCDLLLQAFIRRNGLEPFHEDPTTGALSDLSLQKWGGGKLADVADYRDVKKVGNVMVTSMEAIPAKGFIGTVCSWNSLLAAKIVISKENDEPFMDLEGVQFVQSGWPMNCQFLGLLEAPD